MQVKTQLEDIQNYLTDASNMQGGTAERLFIPETAEEIAGILREASESGTPVTVSGARTGTVGGAIPFGGIVISLERLNKIKSIDKESLIAVVEPGVILGDFQKAVDAQGLFYPPDPTEWSCQIGGTVATNASGARSFKYGATRDFVRRLKVVLPSGEIVDIERESTVSGADGVIKVGLVNGGVISAAVPTYRRPDVRKNVSGYFNRQPADAIDLFIGSEGTLGVIVEIELGLLPKPEGFFSGIVFFKDEGDLLNFVDEARALSYQTRKSASANADATDKRNTASANADATDKRQSADADATDRETADDRDSEAGIDASLIEYFDSNALKFISEKFPETPDGMAGAIFFEQETAPNNEDSVFERWNELLEKYNADIDRSWFTTSEQDREKMRAFRHALPVTVNERIARNGLRKVGTDMAVPDANFPSFLKFYRDILDASGLDYVIFGHIGDCHLHANMIPKNEREAEKARYVYGRCIAQAIMLGGVVSAEHGIGKLKRKYLEAMMGERYLNEMASLKKAFDPKGILGRGNMFAESYLA